MKSLKFFPLALVLVFTVNQLYASGGSASSGGAGSPTTISIFIGGGRTWNGDLANYQKLMKDTNTILDVTTQTGNAANQINLLFASGDLPDVITFSGIGYQPYVSTGYLRPLDDLLRTNGQNILKRTTQDALRLMTLQGKIYAYPREGNQNRAFNFMRSDWIANLGIDLSKNQDYGDFGGKVLTLNEFRDILVQFTRNDPDKNGRNDTYGLGSTVQKTNGGWSTIFGAYGGHVGHYYLVDNKTLPWCVTNEYRQALQFIHSLWTDGLIDPEIYLNTGEQAGQKMINSVSGASVGEGWSSGYSVITRGLGTLVPGSDMIPFWLTSNDGKVSGTPDNGYIQHAVSITTLCKNPEKVMDFLDYLHAEDDGYYTVNLGILGTDYNMIDGFPLRTDSGNALYNSMTLDTLWPLVNRLDLVHHLARRPTDQWEQLQRQKWEFLYMDRNIDHLYSNLFYGISNPPAYNDYGVDVNNWIEQSAMAFITGETPINDTTWNNYINTWKLMGGVRILQGFTDSYNSLNGTSYAIGITE